ncbi:MAG: hypothetical protein JKX71_06075 [Amylibacter sp.]|nr:hypothetical protein [Amylibacter sp.]
MIQPFVSDRSIVTLMQQTAALLMVKKRYPYYLCQTKACDSYGKSIPRDRLESTFGEIVKTLEPSKRRGPFN